MGGKAAKCSVCFALVLSGSSSSSKYDPEILKAEIATTKSRVRSMTGLLLATSNPQIFSKLHDKYLRDVKAVKRVNVANLYLRDKIAELSNAMVLV